MKNDQTPPLEPATFDFLAERLASVGVAGNEGDARFDIQDLPVPLQALRQRLQAAGYVGGELAVEALVRSHDGVDTLIYDTARYARLFEAEQAWERDYRERWRQSRAPCRGLARSSPDFAFANGGLASHTGVRVLEHRGSAASHDVRGVDATLRRFTPRDAGVRTPLRPGARDAHSA
jgi:hypothetical protein